VTLLFTYSGIDDKRIEPYPSSVAAESLRLMSAPQRRKYRTILYWRPLVPGLNDSPQQLDGAYHLAQAADATVFTGLFYRAEIQDYYRANGLPEPYEDTARRKITPETLERRVLAAFDESTPLFRKTSCAVSFAHGLPDYNGHVGIRELLRHLPTQSTGLVPQCPPGANGGAAPRGRRQRAGRSRPGGGVHHGALSRGVGPARRTTPLLPPTRPGLPSA